MHSMAQQKRKASDDAPEVLKERVARRIVAKDRSAVVDGLYRPNERVRSLPSVYEALDQVVLLKCSNCVERISTSWFWKHPRHGRIRALVPSSGHSTCRKSLGKRCPWISLDGTYTCLDKFIHLDFCHHNCQRSICKQCGGTSICLHNRQRTLCKDCGGSGICAHNRQRSFCRECGGSEICPHGRQRSRCKECGGSEICPHNRRRHRCSVCKSQAQG